MEGETPQKEMSPDLLNHILIDIQKDVKETVIQTKLTNGRVSKLENWQNFIMGGLVVLSAIVVPIFLYLVYHAFK